MSSTYGHILRIPGAAAFSIAGLLARFPMSMQGIATILAVQALYDSYSAAGAVSAANIVAAALGAPLLARLVDEHGQSKVMVPALTVSGASMLGLVLATRAHADLRVLMALAALAGGLSGSMGSLVRSRWTKVVTRPEDVHTAFSLEAAFDEVALIIGPVLTTALCTSSTLPVTSGWIASLTLQLAGGLWFLSQRRTEPAPHPQRRAGAEGEPQEGDAEDDGARRPHRPVVRHGAVLVVLVAFLFSGAMFGASDVASVAFATEAGRKSASGALLAAWSVGSLAAALVYGARSWRWPLWRQFLAGTVALSIGASLLPLAPGLVVLGALMAVTGMAIAPTITTGNNIVQASVAPSQLTEGLAWISTSLNVGVSLGSLLGGRAVDAEGGHGGYLMAAVCAWLAATAALAGSRVLRRARTHASLPR